MFLHHSEATAQRLCQKINIHRLYFSYTPETQEAFDLAFAKYLQEQLDLEFAQSLAAEENRAAANQFAQPFGLPRNLPRFLLPNGMMMQAPNQRWQQQFGVVHPNSRHGPTARRVDPGPRIRAAPDEGGSLLLPSKALNSASSNDPSREDASPTAAALGSNVRTKLLEAGDAVATAGSAAALVGSAAAAEMAKTLSNVTVPSFKSIKRAVRETTTGASGGGRGDERYIGPFCGAESVSNCVRKKTWYCFSHLFPSPKAVTRSLRT